MLCLKQTELILKAKPEETTLAVHPEFNPEILELMGGPGNAECSQHWARVSMKRLMLVFKAFIASPVNLHLINGSS